VAIVGSKAQFAVEWQVTDKIGSFTFAKFCFWAYGERIGDFENEVDLPTLSTNLQEYLARSKERYLSELNGKDKEEILSRLYDSIIIPPRSGLWKTSSPQEISRLNWSVVGMWQPVFHLSEIGACFADSVSILLFNDPALGFERLIWRTLDTGQINEALLPPNLFETVVSQFLTMSEKDLSS